MIFHGYYADMSDAEVDAFVQAQRMGRLVTVGTDGTPHLGLYNFVYDGSSVELHIVRADEQVSDLRARGRCVFELDEILTVIPSYWVHPEYAGTATSYHRTVIFECEATVLDEPRAVVAQLERLLAKHQPEGGFRRPSADDPMYTGALGQLAALRLAISRRRVKFKLAQNRPPEVRRGLIGELRKRGAPGDTAAADALEWTIDRTPTRGN
jgi:transcriptional regulator